MEYAFSKLSQDNALLIANEWKYEAPYSFYDMTSDEEDYQEFVNEELRNGNDCFEVMVDKELVGFFCCFIKGNELELGLGLKPSLCGSGKGKSFLDAILKFVSARYKQNKIILNVAAFNQRAIKVYHACGFADWETENRKTNGGTYAFLKLYKEME